MSGTSFSHLSLRCLLPRSAEVCIVGGGIVGSLSALELAERGQKVVLLERGFFGRSQSSQNLGWIRQQGRAIAELPMMVEANALWREMVDRCQSPKLQFTQYGISYFGSIRADAERYENFSAALKQHGVASDILGAAQIRKRHPGTEDRWQIGLCTPSDGRVEPRRAVTAIAAAAGRAGATMVEGCPVLGLETIANNKVRVYSTWGNMDVEKLVIAAGAGTSQLLGLMGHKLPQMCIESTVLEVQDDNAAWAGCGSDGAIAFYRNIAGHIGISLCEKFTHRPGLSTLRNLPSYVGNIESSLRATRLAPPRLASTDPPPSRDSIYRSLALSQRRSIIGQTAQVVRAWAGEIDVLPDYLPAIGPLEPQSPITVAAGFSGHGFGIAPSVARVVADLVAEKTPTHDITRFRLNRFSDGSRLDPGPTF